MKRKIALVVGSTFLCASILSGCASATPVDKYLRSFDKGDSEAASQIYSEEIKDNAEDKEALQTKLKERMDSIYENFKSGKITSDEAKEKLKSYKEYDTSSVYAFTTINKVTTLQKSKDAYSDAEKAENDGNLADAITNYKSVIEDDPNHETAQAKVLQLSETYTETMKAQAQQEADSKDYDRAINTINKLSDVVGNTDELKTLAQEYSELKNYRYIKVVSFPSGFDIYYSPNINHKIPFLSTHLHTFQTLHWSVSSLVPLYDVLTIHPACSWLPSASFPQKFF